MHGEGLGLWGPPNFSAPPDPRRSLSRGTWTVADISPAPGELKTPPGNRPGQKRRVGCRLIKRLARGQQWGRERGNESLQAGLPWVTASVSSQRVGKLEPGARFLDNATPTVPAAARAIDRGRGGRAAHDPLAPARWKMDRLSGLEKASKTPLHRVASHSVSSPTSAPGYPLLCTDLLLALCLPGTFTYMVWVSYKSTLRKPRATTVPEPTSL